VRRYLVIGLCWAVAGGLLVGCGRKTAPEQGAPPSASEAESKKPAVKNAPGVDIQKTADKKAKMGKTG